MSTFENVNVDVAANVYFNGQVTSRTVTFADGSKKTLGIMMPGEYTFGTEVAEKMEITAGKVEVLLPAQSEWQTIVSGQAFDVPANASFEIKVIELADYCCSYYS